MIVGVDIETCSAASLKTQGAAHYAEHPTTRVHCVVITAEDLGGQRLRDWWTPGQELSLFSRECLTNFVVLAHNAAFELSIFKNILVPHFGFPMPGRWRDTMLIAANHNLPLGLYQLGVALGTPHQKDQEGHKLMLSLAKVKQKKGVWIYPQPTAEQLERLVKYCADDVDAMLDCHDKMPTLPREEAQMVEVDRRINERGAMIDTKLAVAIQKMATKREHEIAHVVLDDTLDMIGVRNPAPLKDWLRDQGIELPTAVRKTKDGFRNTDSIDRNAITEILARNDTPELVRDVLDLRLETGRLTSLAKAAKVPRVVCADGRARWQLRYSKAHTGRWSSEQLQLHNLTRPTKSYKQVSGPFLHAIRTGNLDLASMLHSVLEGLSYSLRALVIAGPGLDLIGGDFAGIEARVMALVAGDEEKLAVFRRYDAASTAAERAVLDPYIIAAAKIGSDNRDLGKVCELALQYGMGAIKFRNTALKFGVTLTLKEARRIQLAWRRANRLIVDFWHALQDAVAKSMEQPGVRFLVGDRISVLCSKDCLRIFLPSGRALHYWRPHQKDVVRAIETVDDEGNIVVQEVPMRELRFMRPHKQGMRPESTYGGKLSENVVQAIARDVLRDALLRLDSCDPYDQIVLHVHDSIAVEIRPGLGSPEEFCSVMGEVPTWAPDLPIAVEGYRGRHFKG
jgi:DNA polymerase